jgi:hypothetical protein
MAGNPFDSASRLIIAMRQGALLAGGAGLVATTATTAAHPQPTRSADAAVGASGAELTPREGEGEGLGVCASAGASAGAVGNIPAVGGVAASAREEPSVAGGIGRDDARGIRRGVAAALHAAADQLEQGVALGQELVKAAGGGQQ